MEMNEPLISIIIPCYNIENYIVHTLDSVFSQTYRSIEVIAVDDGSQDSTGAVLDCYAEKEPRLIVFHQDNQGVSLARIHGIEASHGEYIGFVDGDDLIDAEMYDKLYRNAVAYSADISHCGYRVVNRDSVKYYYNTGKVKIQNQRDGVVDLLEGTFIEPGLCCKLYRKQLFDRILSDETSFDSSLRLNEDLLLNFFLFRSATKSIYEDFCPYQYIKRENSASQSESRIIDYAHPIRVRQIIYQQCLGTAEEALAKRIYISKTLHKISEIYEKTGDEFLQFRDEMITIVKQHRHVVPELSLKQQINAALLIYSPILYGVINHLYRKHQ